MHRSLHNFFQIGAHGIAWTVSRIERIMEHMRRENKKTIGLFLVSTFLFVVCADKLLWLLVTAVVASILFGFDPKWFVGVAGVLAVSAIGFFAWNQPYDAEQIATGMYYVFVGGIVIFFFQSSFSVSRKRHVASMYQQYMPTRLFLTVIMIMVIAGGLGFYYLNHKVEQAITRFGAQESSTEHDANSVEAKELTGMRETLRQVIHLSAQDSAGVVSEMTTTSTGAHSSTGGMVP